MRLRFALSGSLVFEGTADCVPPVGSRVVFVMQHYKKGMEPGTWVSATVTDDSPPQYDFTDPNEVVVTLDVDSFVTFEAA